MISMEDLVTDCILEPAYTWLGARRKAYPDAADCWRLRQRWPEERARLTAELLAGTYEIGLLTPVSRRDGETIDLWAARDAVVLKALALVLAPCLPAAPQGYHLAGRGGAKGAVRAVCEPLPESTFVLKTDVQNYYASIDHLKLLDRLVPYSADRRVLNLIGQYLRHGVEWGGLFWDCTRGIVRGCSPSPVLGAFFLYDLDAALEGLGVWWARYMDDIVVLTPTR